MNLTLTFKQIFDNVYDFQSKLFKPKGATHIVSIT